MLDNKCKKCRRAGEKLFLKGEKCFTPKCSLTRKSYPPGIFGRSKGKHPKRGISEYGAQMRERQKIKFSYGLRGRQFANYLKEPAPLIELLESRLDNVVFRLGFSDSRSGARQIVSHGHILVNNRKVNIPSYRVKIGTKILIRPQSANKAVFKDIDIKLKKYNPPSWIKLDKTKKEGEITGRPTL